MRRFVQLVGRLRCAAVLAMSVHSAGVLVVVGENSVFLRNQAGLVSKEHGLGQCSNYQ